MFFVNAQVVNEHRYVLDDFTLLVSEVISNIDVIINHIIVVILFASVRVLIIKLTVGAAADASNGRCKVEVTLRFNQVPHRKVRLQVLVELSF